MTTLTLALVGLGHIAEHQLAALASGRHWRLVGACDIRGERRSLLPRGVPFFETTEELLNKTAADLFMVATPNITHYALGKQVLEAGRNLLLEKPCTQTRAEMAELARLAQRNGVFFSVAMHAAFANDLAWYLDATTDPAWSVERLSGFEAEFYDPLVAEGACLPGAASLGDSWFDSGVNALSVVARLVPVERLRVSSAQFASHGVGGLRAAEACVGIQFSPNQAPGLVRTNWTLGLNRKTTRVILDGGAREVMLHHSEESVIFLEQGREIRRKDLRNERPRLVNHYANLFADAHSRLVEGRSNLDVAVPLHDLLFDAIERGADA